MRFEDYVVARDDNGQQLDEAGIVDTVKGWFGGKKKPLGFAQAASRKLRSDKIAAQNLETLASDKEEAAARTFAMRKAGFGNLQKLMGEVEKTATQAAMAPGKIITTATAQYDALVSLRMEAEKILKTLPIDKQDKDNLIAMIVSLITKASDYLKAVTAQSAAMEGMQENAETVNKQIVEISKAFTKFLYDHIRNLRGTPVKVKEIESDVEAQMPQGTARPTGAIPRVAPPAGVAR